MLVGLSPPKPVTGFVLDVEEREPAGRSADPGQGHRSGKRHDPGRLAVWRGQSGRVHVRRRPPLGRLVAGSEEYDKFFSQMIRYAMRPVNEEGKFNVATDVKDGQVRVVVTALDKNDEFLNFLNMSGAGTGPEMSNDRCAVPPGRAGPLHRRIPGRQSGQLSAGRQHGPDQRRRRCSTGVSVPYSAEFRERETNQALLTTLASTQAGRRSARQDDSRRAARRGPSIGSSPRSILFAARWPKPSAARISGPPFCSSPPIIFSIDVFIRRVTVHFYWVMPAAGPCIQSSARHSAGSRARRTAGPAPQPQSRHRPVRSRSGEPRASSRSSMKPPSRPRGYEEVIADASGGGGRVAAAACRRLCASAIANAGNRKQDTYTERLLAAKKKAQGANDQ